jgi:hypothetical protein
MDRKPHANDRLLRGLEDGLLLSFCERRAVGC